MVDASLRISNLISREAVSTSRVGTLIRRGLFTESGTDFVKLKITVDGYRAFRLIDRVTNCLAEERQSAGVRLTRLLLVAPN